MLKCCSATKFSSSRLLVFLLFRFSFSFLAAAFVIMPSYTLSGWLGCSPIDSKPSSFISLCVTSCWNSYPNTPNGRKSLVEDTQQKNCTYKKNVNSALFFLIHFPSAVRSNDCCIYTRTNEPVFRLSSHVDVWRKDFFFFFFCSFWGFPFFVLACHPRLPSEMCEDCVLLSTGSAE
jgi:hypothetical protein